MVDEVRELLTRLNDALQVTGVTPYRLGIAAPEDLLPAPKNARFMRQQTFASLINNVKRDGNLASLPFCWKSGDEYFILSGHHRVDAAKKAGVKSILFLYTDAALTESERVAIQLSHNALAGEDSLATLKELYELIDEHDLKAYSGLDDATVGKLAEIAPTSFQDARLEYQQVVLLFLPVEVESLAKLVERLPDTGETPVYAAHLSDWPRFWEMLLRFKETQHMVNTATAMSEIIRIVTNHLDALAAAQAEQCAELVG
jgi:hypothetical protein